MGYLGVQVSICQFVCLCTCVHPSDHPKKSANFKTLQLLNSFHLTVGIKHGCSCITIRQVPWGVLKTEARGRGFQHFPRDLANVNTLKNHVPLLLLHKN